VQLGLCGPDFEKRLRAELVQQVKQAVKPGNIKAIDRGLAELKNKIDRGTENIMLAEASELGEWRAKLAEWRAQYARLQDERRAARGVSVSANQIDGIVSEAIKELARLHNGLSEDEPAVLRELLSQIVERIDVWFDSAKVGTVKRCILKRGLITLRVPSAFHDKETTFAR
jgi:hypothetical protein